MGSNYNTRGRSAEVALENGQARLIRKRENFEDLIALEKEFI
jgi:diaminopimelate decarboxylase